MEPLGITAFVVLLLPVLLIVAPAVLLTVSIAQLAVASLEAAG